MALGIYTSADPDTALSEDGTHTNDFLVSINGRTGGIVQKLIYVRNDEDDKFYENLALSMMSENSGDSYFDNSIGYSWKLSSGSEQPDDLQWDLVDHNNSVSLADLGDEDLADTSTYLPIWVRIAIPRNQVVNTVLDLRFELNADESIIV